jgi:hypothetical protein
MKVYVGVETLLHAFITAAVVIGGEWFGSMTLLVKWC